MNVVIAHEAKVADSGCYHLLNDERTASERRGLDACVRCTSIANGRPVERSATDD